jgi:hypothetical protein
VRNAQICSVLQGIWQSLNGLKEPLCLDLQEIAVIAELSQRKEKTDNDCLTVGLKRCDAKPMGEQLAGSTAVNFGRAHQLTRSLKTPV